MCVHLRIFEIKLFWLDKTWYLLFHITAGRYERYHRSRKTNLRTFITVIKHANTFYSYVFYCLNVFYVRPLDFCSLFKVRHVTDIKQNSKYLTLIPNVDTIIIQKLFCEHFWFCYLFFSYFLFLSFIITYFILQKYDSNTVVLRTPAGHFGQYVNQMSGWPVFEPFV